MRVGIRLSHVCTTSDASARDHAPLLLVVLPYRATLARSNRLTPAARDVWETLEKGRAAHQRVVGIARDLGIDVIDAWEPFAQVIGRDGSEQWFAHDRVDSRYERHTFYNRFERQITRETVQQLIPKWRYYTGGIITASPAVAWIPLPEERLTQTVFVPSWDSALYALRAEDGTRVWSFTMKPHPGASYPNASSPAVAWLDGRAVVYAPGGMTTYCLDAVTGALIWEFDAGTGCTTCGFNPGDPTLRERNEILSSPTVYGWIAGTNGRFDIMPCIGFLPDKPPPPP